MSPESSIRKSLVAAGLLALVGGQALAQSVPVPVRSQGFRFVSPDGPSVLDTDAVGHPLAPASRPDLTVPSVPVAEVMNGGAFGLTGFDYYNDQISEGRFGARRRPKEYVIAPAYLVPPRY